MGIKNLNVLIKNFKKKENLSKYSCGKFGIDLNLYLYKFLCFNSNNYLSSFFNQITLLLNNNITPVYIFDGLPPPEKIPLLNERNEKLNKLNEKLKDLEPESQEYKNIKRQIIKPTKEHYINIKRLFDSLGVTWYKANGEADHLLSQLYRNNKIDGVVTCDLDTLSSGTGLCIFDLKNNSTDIYTYKLQDILTGLDITYAQFLDICILCKCDYTGTVYGIGPKKALNFIKIHTNIENCNFDTSSCDYIMARSLLIKNDYDDLSTINIKLNPLNKKDLIELLKKTNTNVKDLDKKIKTFYKFNTNTNTKITDFLVFKNND